MIDNTDPFILELIDALKSCADQIDHHGERNEQAEAALAKAAGCYSTEGPDVRLGYGYEQQLPGLYLYDAKTGLILASEDTDEDDSGFNYRSLADTCVREPITRLLGEAWVVVTSRNRGSIDAETPLYTSISRAWAAAQAENRADGGRGDWIVIPLNEAIKEAVDDACANAMDEG